MSLNIKPVILAGLGGTLPTTAQLAASLAAQPEQPLPHWHILFAFVLFFVIGAVLSIAFNKNEDLGQAIVIGISAPAIITNIINGALSGSGKPPQPTPPKISELLHDRQWWPQITSSAFAQTTQPNSSQVETASGRKSIVLTITYAGQVRPDNGSLSITAIGKNAPPTYLGTFGVAQFVVLSVPDATESLAIRTQDNSVSRELQLWAGPDPKPPSFAVNIRLLARTSGAGDVLWGLGAERRTFVMDADITKFPLSTYAPPSVTDASATSCNDEKTLASLPGDRAAQIAFTNNTSAVRDVYWINYLGQRVFYKALQPGENYVQPTFITHPWVITDGGGACKATIVAQQPSLNFQIKN